MLNIYMGDKNEFIPTDRPGQTNSVPLPQPVSPGMGMGHGSVGGEGWVRGLMARQGCEELETGPAAGSLEQGLIVPEW